GDPTYVETVALLFSLLRSTQLHSFLFFTSFEFPLVSFQQQLNRTGSVPVRENGQIHFHLSCAVVAADPLRQCTGMHNSVVVISTYTDQSRFAANHQLDRMLPKAAKKLQKPLPWTSPRLRRSLPPRSSASRL